LKTLETVPADTPAARATSASFAAFPILTVVISAIPAPARRYSKPVEPIQILLDSRLGSGY
jgi:hypothetical protein